MDALISSNYVILGGMDSIHAVLVNLTLAVQVLHARLDASSSHCNRVEELVGAQVAQLGSWLGREFIVGLILDFLSLLRSPILAFMLLAWGYRQGHGYWRAFAASVVMFLVDPVGSVSWLLLLIGESCGRAWQGTPPVARNGGGAEGGNDAEAGRVPAEVEPPAGRDPEARNPWYLRALGGLIEGIMRGQ